MTDEGVVAGCFHQMSVQIIEALNCSVPDSRSVKNRIRRVADHLGHVERAFPDRRLTARCADLAAIRDLSSRTATILGDISSRPDDERSYVLDYERRNPKFPHEPTSDQFFSEEQFEAYRALGFHAMTNALELDDGTPRSGQLRQRLLLGLPAAAANQG